MLVYILLLFLVILFLVYIGFYLYLSSKVKDNEEKIIDMFLKKVSKIPALIEVMRPYVAREESFRAIIEAHTQVIIESTHSIYDILGHDGKIQNEFAFLMKLSVQIPDLQKHEYFLYVRNFILEYGKIMKQSYANFNKFVILWNKFIRIKNYTWIGLFFPGKAKIEIP